MLKVLLVWDNSQVYHYNVVDKMRLSFIGKTTDDMEKRKAFVSDRCVGECVQQVFNLE